jgi:signal transduction histidine kinase
MTQNHSVKDSSEELAEILPIAIVKFDRREKALHMNRACLELLASMKITPEALPRLLPPRYRTFVRQALWEKRVAEVDWFHEGRSLHLIFQSSEEGPSAYVFIIDVTAQAEAEAQLIQSEKMASLGLLMAGLAHEINTPLGAIHSNNDTIARSVEKIKELLERDESLAVDNKRSQMRLVQIMQELCRNNSLATERLIDIVGSLKNFARLDEAELKKADIHEGIESTLTIVQHQLKNRIRVEKQFGNIPLVECYPNRLNQVFMNLLINAAQAIPDRGTITIKTSRKGEFVKIAIADTGIGIPEENLSKVFDPGFTTKGVGVGTGLGLSICYKIIQEHQGKIQVESDQGTTFTITLPLKHSRKVARV